MWLNRARASRAGARYQTREGVGVGAVTATNYAETEPVETASAPLVI